MTKSTESGDHGNSTRPYLIRALHDWCTDNGFTPYLSVFVDRSVQVPMDYVKDNEIVLNIGFEATSGLKLGNEFIEFKARFGGVGREIVVPVDHVVAIYARENGQGMAFPVPAHKGDTAGSAEIKAASGRGLRLAHVEEPVDPQPGVPAPRLGWRDEEPPEPPAPPPANRPSLKRVK
jgi:stringent starvation protein B